MTRYELMKLLGLKSMSPISIAIKKATDDGKLKVSKKFRTSKENDLSKEQIITICHYLWATPKPLMEEWIKEHFITRDKTFKIANRIKSVFFQGTEAFIKNPLKKCCSTCEYCIPKTFVRKKPILHPFCKKTEYFCGKMGMNPYLEYSCPYYKRSKDNPKIWLTSTSLETQSIPERFSAMEYKKQVIKSKKTVEWKLPFLDFPI